jgi:hypothetical protein
LADSSQALILEALSRAATEPEGVPLLASKAAPGLFARSAAGKNAARRCQEDGLIHILRSETRGKTTYQVCAITDKGLAHVLGQTNLRQVLEAFVSALQARQGQVDALLASARACQTHLETLRGHAEKVLRQMQERSQSPVPAHFEKNGKHATDCGDALVAQLRRWHEAHALEDCALPELFRLLKPAHPPLSIGQFHDSLRRLHEQRQVYLHPWTGLLYELPEPALALMVGHEIAYYASLQG